MVAEESRLHVAVCADAGGWDRCEHGDVQRDQYGVVGTTAIRGSGSPRVNE
jgi:hypothetical protein